MKQLGEIKVEEYMSVQPIVVQDTSLLTAAIKTMDDNHLSVVPVANEQAKLVGILSSSDLIGIVHEIQSDLGALHHVNDKTRDFLVGILIDQGDNTLVSDVMTEPVETISAHDNLIVAAQRLSRLRIHHLPVVDEDDNPVGILSSTDFVRAIAENGAIATA